HLPNGLRVDVAVTGTPVPLPAEAEHSLLRLAGQALFNIVSHSTARRALVRLRYRPDRVVLSVADDGDGDPAQLRRTLRLTGATDLAGMHRGLANMAERTRELGGTMTICRSTLGGIE